MVRAERPHGRGQRFLIAGRMASSVRAGAFGMAIDPSGDWVRPLLTGSGGRGLPACEQKFALDLK